WLDDGIGWMTGRVDDWSQDNGFAFHNWWHLALYHLDLGEHDRVLRLYDEAIRPRPTDIALEMVDATSMLWRLHLRSVDVGDRWHELADLWAGHIEDGYYAFNDAHAMMAFVATGRDDDAERLLATLRRRAEGGGTNGMMTRDVGLPMATALRDFGAGR